MKQHVHQFVFNVGVGMTILSVLAALFGLFDDKVGWYQPIGILIGTALPAYLYQFVMSYRQRRRGELA